MSGAEPCFLVVESVRRHADELVHLLSGYGTVSVFESIRTLERASGIHDRWDGLLFDHVLGDGNGLDLLQRFRDRGCIARAALLVAADDDADVANRALRLHASLLPKPAHATSLGQARLSLRVFAARVAAGQRNRPAAPDSEDRTPTQPEIERPKVIRSGEHPRPSSRGNGYADSG